MIIVTCLLKYQTHKHTHKKVATKELKPWVCELLYACPYRENDVQLSFVTGGNKVITCNRACSPLVLWTGQAAFL